MERINTAEAVTVSAVAVLGGYISNLLGGWDTWLSTLLTFMAIDYVTGLMLAGIFKKSNKTEDGTLSSGAGWRGLCKKAITLAIVVMASKLDTATGSHYIRDGVVVAYIVIESVSIIENAGQMGVPIPAPLKKSIEVLRYKNEEE